MSLYVFTILGTIGDELMEKIFDYFVHVVEDFDGRISRHPILKLTFVMIQYAVLVRLQHSLTKLYI